MYEVKHHQLKARTECKWQILSRKVPDVRLHKIHVDGTKERLHEHDVQHAFQHSGQNARLGMSLQGGIAILNLACPAGKISLFLGTLIMLDYKPCEWKTDHQICEIF